MRTGITVSEVMTKKPITVAPGTNLKECAKLMDGKHVGSLLVKDGPGVVGIVTEQDIVRKAVLKDAIPSKTLVDDVMAMNLRVVSPSQDVYDAILKMRENNIRHLPVIDDHEQFVGLITAKDILRIQPELFKLLAETIEKRK
ncbi:MAG TPA: CBS domain-containing protein [Candidatus Binatia bacterium]|nr:CBS domain-containing protein [Candidatus Binatia bacterium]